MLSKYVLASSPFCTKLTRHAVECYSRAARTWDDACTLSDPRRIALFDQRSMDRIFAAPCEPQRIRRRVPARAARQTQDAQNHCQYLHRQKTSKYPFLKVPSGTCSNGSGCPGPSATWYERNCERFFGASNYSCFCSTESKGR